ncbi:MAG: hypothetical protein KGO02_15845 [Alphaproteobacteria bacterium]|nr:hypothetical protein [Alphaproteobacteria bacterium]
MDFSSTHIMSTGGTSLRRLRMDHVDHYQIHRFYPYTTTAEAIEVLQLSTTWSRQERRSVWVLHPWIGGSLLPVCTRRER